MSQTKIEQSKSYREFLLGNLQDVEHAAGYLAAALTEEDSDPAFLNQLLKSAIEDVIEARSLNGSTLSEIRLLRDRFADAQSKGSDIRSFIQLLDALGFKVSIEPKALESIDD